MTKSSAHSLNANTTYYDDLYIEYTTWDGEEVISTPVEGIVSASLSMLSVQIG